MIRFSVKWASVGGVYAGMLFGVAMMVAQSGRIGIMEITMGLFFGGAMALPLGACQVVGALVSGLVAGDAFLPRFIAFTIVSLGCYIAMLDWLDQGLLSMGGLLHGSDPYLGYLLFFAAGTTVSLICMAAASLRRDPGPAGI